MRRLLGSSQHTSTLPLTTIPYPHWWTCSASPLTTFPHPCQQTCWTSKNFRLPILSTYVRCANTVLQLTGGHTRRLTGGNARALQENVYPSRSLHRPDVQQANRSNWVDWTRRYSDAGVIISELNKRDKGKRKRHGRSRAEGGERKPDARRCAAVTWIFTTHVHVHVNHNHPILTRGHARHHCPSRSLRAFSPPSFGGQRSCCEAIPCVVPMHAHITIIVISHPHWWPCQKPSRCQKHPPGRSFHVCPV
ncbi:hypothetical protein BDP27DRAFT_50383 [Rhodocollybia butyracea]|uniref:Uncharacterized protein n=1 Tax=Rhodocollybia butyracea TaxID=206335 RepID=A0A9P5U3D8_9AGAR|nr:hypothetical protein BDP27DRAFT_50383 [Rhodocollybia butyracea]